MGSHQGWCDGSHPRRYARPSTRDGDPARFCKEIFRLQRIEDFMDLVCIVLTQDVIPMLTIRVQGIDSIHGYVKTLLHRTSAS